MTWAWLILAAACFIGEMLTAGFFLIVFGIGAAGAALVAAFGGGQLWQWLVFIVVSGLSFALSRKFASKIHRGPEGFGVGAERYTGTTGMITETVDNAGAIGMIRIDREEWQAQSDDGAVIEAGNWAVVVRVDGTRMIVKASETGSEPATNAGSEQANDAGSEQANDAGSEQANDAGSEQATDA